MSSYPAGFERRKVIRQTWLSESHLFPEFKVLFLFGKPGPREKTVIQDAVKDEQEKHCDIIQFDFIDHYANMHALKFALGWKWKLKPEFLIIADDDTYVNMGKVQDFLINGKQIHKVMRD